MLSACCGSVALLAAVNKKTSKRMKALWEIPTSEITTHSKTNQSASTLSHRCHLESWSRQPSSALNFPIILIIHFPPVWNNCAALPPSCVMTHVMSSLILRRHFAVSRKDCGARSRASPSFLYVHQFISFLCRSFTFFRDVRTATAAAAAMMAMVDINGPDCSFLSQAISNSHAHNMQS